ncbi:Calx-beta domain-containing protein [Cnuella takakiae]|uniref:Calx-beta domain-containing protein n=1 Tax=Cnuella takakiae TaxID=1302690 RepID=A0A1M4X0X5_9BACT|nr:family 16 glycosylhydrolase [Cnuella takakiae]OLY91566.1 hypothetical protein BUE76_06350 [Cnuella takakiae]SHE87134.1 Calx-beta domain-containing protein [Cnuella takakiae]
MKKIIVASVIAICGCSKGSSGEPEKTPAISISDVATREGNTGKNAFDFEVRLSNSFSKPVTVSYSTADEFAKGGEDFVAVSGGTVTIPAGQTTGKISIEVNGDDVREGNETFSVRLSGPVNATISRGIASGRIGNDDTRIAFSNEGFDAPATYPGYSLLWSDEFNGTSLDQAAWTAETGDGCPNLCSWGNNELQYYSGSPNTIFFQDGKMIIEAANEAFGGRNYTSARIKTQGKKAFKYGRIDIRAKLPQGKGIWPAFWLMPENSVFGAWPRSGEIDMMELLGHEPNKVYGTVHFGPGPGSTQISRSTVNAAGALSNAFHVYSLEWKEDQIQWLIDGNVFSTISKADLGTNNYPFNEAFHLIVNLAVGGNWPGNPDASTYFPAWLIVDYVRVYQ